MNKLLNFQYKFEFETENVSYTPKLYNVTVSYSGYSAGVDETSLSSSSTITDSDWHYAAITYDNNTAVDNFKLYLDSTVTSKTDHNTSEYIDNDLLIGKDYQSSAYFDGSVDEFRIYDYALTTEQIENNYNLNYNKIISTETTRLESYICSITPNDDTVDGITKNSSTLTITNHIPSPVPTCKAD